MSGDEGPYVQMDGPGVWVPRTVSYLKARQIAKEAIQDYGDRIRYLGKVNATMFRFVRDCDCDEQCELAAREWNEPDEPEPPEGYDACEAPAWAFEIYEP